jgi:arabinofuranosyltransferase
MQIPDSQPELKTTDSVSLQGRQAKLAVMLMLSAIFAVVLIRRAWLCDDAYITFRTVDNFLHGYRLTWNITERVQAYTHPLWMLLLTIFAFFFTRDLYFTSLGLSIAIALGVVFFLGYRFSKSETSAALAVVILILSRAFVDYSTAGLENSLSHLLILIFYFLFFKGGNSPKRIFLLSCIASLGLLNRMDLALVFAPALVMLLWQSRNWQTVKWLLLGQVPFILWEIFATLYYGFPFPNTAYAKLNTGIPNGEYIQQGLLYLLNSIQFDPVTLTAILASSVLILFNKERKYYPLLVGMGLYVLYVIKVGGDFMSGRFLTVPLMCAVMLLSQVNIQKITSTSLILIYAAILVLGLTGKNNTFQINELGAIDSGPIHVGENGILDERMLYYGGTGLLNVKRNQPPPYFYWGIDGERVRTQQMDVVDQYGVGLFGYYAGPQVYVLDRLALADPLLARLPAMRAVEWRIGHMMRKVPGGYVDSLKLKGNRIQDEKLAEYYEKLLVITRGSLFSPERLVEIWKMNTGQYDYLIDYEAYRYPEMVKINQDSLLTKSTNENDTCSTAGAIKMNDSGVEMNLDSTLHAAWLEMGLDDDDRYWIEYFQGEKIIASQSIATAYLPEPGGISTRLFQVPQKAVKSGYDRIRIFPLSGDGDYCLGYFKTR